MMAIAISLLVIILIESVLSFDNAAVLALIVNKNLSDPKERKQALRWGMLGAFLFRGLSLFLVSWLLNNPAVGDWFRIIGGLYLLKLGYTGLTPKADSIEEGEVGWADKILKWLKLSTFWSTVIVVEMVDLVFSIDNLVAVIGLSSNFWVVVVGVFIGIITMRFVATKFTELMQKYSSLETSAFVVILMLGFKLGLLGLAGLMSWNGISFIMMEHSFDIWFSALMMLIFFGPIITEKFKIQS